MSSAAKCLFMLLMLCATAGVNAKTLRLLIIGDEMASNCHEFMHAPFKGVFQVGPDGIEVPAADPLAWADCSRGSMWLPLGKRIVESGMADRVVLMPIGVSQSAVNDWRPGGKAFAVLDKAVGVIRRQGIKFDVALWQQGPADVGSNYLRYAGGMRGVLQYLGLNVPIKRWLVARYSACHGQFDANIGKVQRVVGSIFLAERYPGPDIDALGQALRTDGCLLNRAGQEQAAQAWLAAMQAADKLANQAHQEALLDWFQ